jgi:hypothetical protein
MALNHFLAAGRTIYHGPNYWINRAIHAFCARTAGEV